MRALLAAALLLLAGCASPIDGQSTPTCNPQNPDECGGRQEFKDGTGGIQVVVVDEGIRPVANATVTLASGAGGSATNENGELAFVDLPQGNYIVTASAPGYLPEQQTVAVAAGNFTLAKIILKADRRPQPYHFTYPLKGHMDAWAGIGQFLVEDATGGSGLCTCSIKMQPEPDLVAVIFEAFWEPTLPDPGAVANYYWYVRQTDGQGLQQGDYCFSPCQVAVGTGTYVQGAELEARLDGPDVWPAADQDFDLYVTLWYHAPPPPGWSIADETP